jgi:hypothetical protein
VQKAPFGAFCIVLELSAFFSAYISIRLYIRLLQAVGRIREVSLHAYGTERISFPLILQFTTPIMPRGCRKLLTIMIIRSKA